MAFSNFVVTKWRKFIQNILQYKSSIYHDNKIKKYFSSCPISFYIFIKIKSINVISSYLLYFYHFANKPVRGPLTNRKNIVGCCDHSQFAFVHTQKPIIYSSISALFFNFFMWPAIIQMSSNHTHWVQRNLIQTTKHSNEKTTLLSLGRNAWLLLKKDWFYDTFNFPFAVF